MLAVTRTPPLYGLATPQLGSAASELRADMVRYLGPIIGSDKAGGMFDKFMAAIQEQAGIGAKTKVMPLVVGALAASGRIAAVGVGLGVAKKRRQQQGS